MSSGWEERREEGVRGRGDSAIELILITSVPAFAAQFWKVGGLSEVSGGAFLRSWPRMQVAEGFTQQTDDARSIWEPQSGLQACWSVAQPRSQVSLVQTPPLMHGELCPSLSQVPCGLLIGCEMRDFRCHSSV